MPRKIRSIEERLWAKVDKTSSPYGCWLYTGAKNKGYGVLQVGTHGKSKLESAPRLAWGFLRGPIPLGMDVLHNCPGGDNPACCNHAHLYLGTQKINALDAEAKGQFNHPLGTDNGKAKLNPDAVAFIFAHYVPYKCSCRKVAEMLGQGVTWAAVYDVIRGRTWSHLKSPVDSPSPPP